jgi:hypothetical protein
MASINKVSEQVIDLAERFADVADAAQGKGTRRRRARGTLAASSCSRRGTLRASHKRLLHAASQKRRQSGQGASL